MVCKNRKDTANPNRIKLKKLTIKTLLGRKPKDLLYNVARWQVFDLQTFKYLHTVDATNPQCGNWMRYVGCARYLEEQNIVSSQHEDEVYYQALKVGRTLLWNQIYWCAHTMIVVTVSYFDRGLSVVIRCVLSTVYQHFLFNIFSEITYWIVIKLYQNDP